MELSSGPDLAPQALTLTHDSHDRHGSADSDGEESGFSYCLCVQMQHITNVVLHYGTKPFFSTPESTDLHYGSQNNVNSGAKHGCQKVKSVF